MSVKFIESPFTCKWGLINVCKWFYSLEPKSFVQTVVIKMSALSISWLLNRAEDFWYVKAVVLFCL